MKLVCMAAFVGALVPYAAAQSAASNSDDAKRVISYSFDVLADKFSWTVEVGKYQDSEFVSATPPILIRFEYSFADASLTVNGQKQGGLAGEDGSKWLGDMTDKLEWFCIKQTTVWSMQTDLQQKPDKPPAPEPPAQEPEQKPQPLPTHTVLKAALSK